MLPLPMQPMTWVSAQETIWSTKYWALAHACAWQSAMQDKLTLGGNSVVLMHPKMQVRTAEHPRAVHAPQSAAQFVHVSYGPSHFPLPQTEQTPQSWGHEAQVSLASHVPFPHAAHSPQSRGQV
jgi:hypothetical protein